MAPLLVFFSIILLASAFICWLDVYSMKSALPIQVTSTAQGTKMPVRTVYSLHCSNRSILSQTCPTNHPVLVTSKISSQSPSATSTCPDYFRWIHEDLKPWKNTGITRDTLESAKGFAHFRLVVVRGKLYMEKYKRCFQTRDLFTAWGILQLLRLYPGKVPDLELMFSCSDRPEIERTDYEGPNATSPAPPIFQYCGHDEYSRDIVFPDWTFWGWAERKIRPWKSLLGDIRKGNKKTKWKHRLPYAYWKGNPNVTSPRGSLIKCNASTGIDWGARLYKQDWIVEARQGYRHSKLESQCNYRYKIYVEGRGWSVSEKYILACDSMVLFVKSHYYDFFTRSMVPLEHYWPITVKNMCRDIKFAVEWGNRHADKAQAIGKAGSKFIEENLGMEYVYDYMFHLLNDYAKLLKFRPVVPKGAMELCSEKLACTYKGLWKKYMVESMVDSASDALPCTLPPPFDPTGLQIFLDQKGNLTLQVEKRANKYWENLNKKQAPAF